MPEVDAQFFLGIVRIPGCFLDQIGEVFLRILEFVEKEIPAKWMFLTINHRSADQPSASTVT